MPRYELAMITRIMSKVSLRDGCRFAKINWRDMYICVNGKDTRDGTRRKVTDLVIWSLIQH